jgi:hypothetical protein
MPRILISGPATALNYAIYMRRKDETNLQTGLAALAVVSQRESRQRADKKK